ncbi:MAG: ABC transporter substrate-binding protein [Wenzhouxiangella sp.]|jgi:ABC-type transport system substrate-binding protein|nr:ABC transporter substrate-binding protein [Wenzhouxiangella sp.]
MPLRQSRLLVCLILLVLTACEREAGQPQSVYRHAIDGVPGSLDPAHAGNVYASTLVVNIFDTLYRYRYLARPYELAPNLAEDFPEVSEDGLVFTFRLREARFADDPVFADGRGRPVTADDVVFSIRRHFDPATRSQGAWLWRDRIVGLDDWGRDGADPAAEIAGLRALDDRTVRIELTRPYPQLVETLAMALSAVVPSEAVAAHGREFAVRPVGSGPFRLLSLDETRAVLAPNPNFKREPLDLVAEGFTPSLHARYGLEELDGQRYPMIDRLEVHFIPEPASRWNSFFSGREVDNLMLPPEQAVQVLSSVRPLVFQPQIERQFQTYVGQETGLVFYGFNMANPDMGHHDDPARERDNRALRCAIREAFDWQARNEIFYQQLGEIYPGVIPPFLREYDAALPRDSIDHDPAAARRHLAENGWTAERLPSLVYGFESTVERRQMFEQFRAQMAAVGYPSEKIRPAGFGSFGEYHRAIINGEVDLFLIGWTLAYPDAHYSLQMFYGPNAAPGANLFNYSNSDFDALFRRASTLSPGPERTELYRTLNRMVIDDCVVIGSLTRTRVHLWHPRVRMLPDREVLSGFFLRFVDVQGPAS